MKKLSSNPFKIRKGNYVRVAHSDKSGIGKVLSVKKGRAFLDNEILRFKHWPLSLLVKVNMKEIQKNGRCNPLI